MENKKNGLKSIIGITTSALIEANEKDGLVLKQPFPNKNRAKELVLLWELLFNNFELDEAPVSRKQKRKENIKKLDKLHRLLFELFIKKSEREIQPIFYSLIDRMPKIREEAKREIKENQSLNEDTILLLKAALALDNDKLYPLLFRLLLKPKKSEIRRILYSLIEQLPKIREEVKMEIKKSQSLNCDTFIILKVARALDKIGAEDYTQELIKNISA